MVNDCINELEQLTFRTSPPLTLRDVLPLIINLFRELDGQGSAVEPAIAEPPAAPPAPAAEPVEPAIVEPAIEGVPSEQGNA